MLVVAIWPSRGDLPRIISVMAVQVGSCTPRLKKRIRCVLNLGVPFRDFKRFPAFLHGIFLIIFLNLNCIGVLLEIKILVHKFTQKFKDVH